MHLWGDFLPTLLHSLLPLLIFLICASWCRCEPVRGMSCTTKPSIASCRHPQPVCVIHMCMQNEHSPSQCLNAVRILEQGDALSSSECLSGANTMSNPVEHCMHTVACAHTHAHTLQQVLQPGQCSIIHCHKAAHVIPLCITVAVYLAVHALQPAGLGCCPRLSSARLMQAALPVGLVLS